MSTQQRALLFPALFATLGILYTALAWNGDHIALLLLMANMLILAFFAGFYGKMVAEILPSWGESTEMWGASQEWGMQQSKILRDAITDLAEFNNEAAAIHTGRSVHANKAYLEAMHEKQEEHERVS
jgi:hypothetical protein